MSSSWENWSFVVRLFILDKDKESQKTPVRLVASKQGKTLL